MIQRNNKTIKHIYKGEAPTLPEEYQEVEYISTDGLAYIDTGIKPSTRDKHEAVFDYQLSNSTSQVLFGSCLGAWNVTPNNWMLFRPYQSATVNRLILWYRTTGSAFNYVADNHFVPGTKQQLLVEQTSDTAVRIKLNSTLDQSIATRNVPIESDQPNYFLLKYQRSDMTVPLDTTMKIYRYKLSQNGVLVRDFIPCYRRSDNKPGMYDLINNVFYVNAYSSGEFAVGAKVIYKKVGVIVDSQGRTIFSDSSNLFKGYDSEWSLHTGCFTSGGIGNSLSATKLTFFFAVKPSTTYRYTSTTTGDRFMVFALPNLHENPPVLGVENTPPYGDTVRVIYNASITSGLADYTFTTSATDKMVYIYCSRNSLPPTGIYVRKV